MRRQILKRRLAYGEENVVVVLCNPNTADDKMDDHTTTKCMNFFRNKGYSLMTFVNLFTIRSAHPKELRNVIDPVGDNDIASVLKNADLVVYGWGKLPVYLMKHYLWNEQEPEFLRSVADPWCFGVNSNGAPTHPARIPLKLVQFRQASADAIEAQRLEKKNRKEVKQLLDDLISVILENLS